MFRRKSKAVWEVTPRLFAFSRTMFKRGRISDIMQAYGDELHLGLPSEGRGDAVAVWGRANTYPRGRKIAKWRDVPIVTMEDGFIRSLKTGRQGDLTESLIVDRKGIYFDCENPNELSDLIEESQVITGEEFRLSEQCMNLLSDLHLSKYNAHKTDQMDLPRDFILVIDQTRDDASIRLGGGGASSFRDMLDAAITENPGKTVLIKTHPETNAGKRAGYFSKADTDENVQLIDNAISPWVLFDRAAKIYCVTSQMGMEAIFSGHKPVVFGRPVYAGWGMTDDRHKDQEYKGLRGPVHLFWAAYLHYCRWYDPYRKAPTDFETVAWNIHARAAAWRWGRKPAVMLGMRLWKRGFLRRYLSSGHAPRFVETNAAAVAAAKAQKAHLLVWANKVDQDLVQLAKAAKVTLTRVEDGFLRSSGLGAALVPPVSLAFDDLGIYYDPRSESRLERLISEAVKLPEIEVMRAGRLRIDLVEARLSKYNLKGRALRFNPSARQQLVLIPGQVEDDASILTGTEKIKTNKELIWAVRQALPNAFLIYKPHPDVEAGLRDGAVAADFLKGVVDHVASDADIASLIDAVDVVATMTSLTGFEALLRGKRVICFGTPFYAGWGLTEDRATIPARRKAKISLDQLVHATLIGYPRYWDPVTGDPCTPEVILHRFQEGRATAPLSARVKILAKLQGVFASYAPLWRR